MPHTDAQYFHQPTEVNLWLPLTPAHGSNSLFAESAAGVGDFKPFECLVGAGECVQFYGNGVRHFTKTNETDITRCSLELRIIPAPLFIAGWRSPRGGCHLR